MTTKRHLSTLRSTLAAAVAIAFVGACDSSESKTSAKPETKPAPETKVTPAAEAPRMGRAAARPALDDRVPRDDFEEQPEKEEKKPEQCKHPQATMAGTCKAKGNMPSCYSGMNGSRGVCDFYECRGGTLYRCDGVVVVDDEPGHVGDDPLKRSCSPTQSGDDCTEIPI
ncbi:MAG: hypothetical protein AAF799_28775 [Myxococcota bacterium]